MRYTVPDLPPSKVAAFTPIPASTRAGSTWGLIEVVGSPGLLSIESPNPDESLPTISSQRGVNSSRPSDLAPDVFFPILYVAGTANQGPTVDAGIGMWRRRLCELPIPAINPTRIPTSDSLVTQKGSRTTQAWPRAFQRFPTS